MNDDLYTNLHQCNISSLEQISIIRTHIPLLRLFKFRQTKICARLIPIPILHQHTSGVNAASRRAQTRKTNADAIALSVKVRRIRSQESVRGDDSANVAEADLPRCSYSAAMVTTKIEVEPADYYRKGRVSAHGDEKQRRIFEMRPRMHCQ